MEIKNTQLMFIATVGSFGLLYLLLFKPVPDENVQLFIFIAGSVSGFFFGSSINKSKADTNALPPTQSQATGQPAASLTAKSPNE